MSSDKFFKVIACEALARPVYYYSALSPHRIDVELHRIGLHDHPDQLRTRLQTSIDETSSDYDAILLSYGLCGRAIDGLKSNQMIIVVPRAHDCITLLLGSRKAYIQEQESEPGTYWYSQDYLERSGRYGASMALGSGMPDDLQSTYEEYIQKYGQDNADYLIQTLSSWQSHYKRAALVESELGISDNILEKAAYEAEKRKWQLEKIAGDLTLVRRLLFCDWNDDFLIVPENSSIKMSMDDQIISCNI
jgi:hypothetical protein